MKFAKPRGMRDFPPDIMILRKKIIRKIEEIFELYGYDPIDTPVLEYWNTLKGKYGDEAENKLVYRFKDPFSDKEFALRYDLTVPLARFISNQYPSLPFKRYHIAKVWRHEEPQKGRYREFFQCDIDIVGANTADADAEILLVFKRVFDSFGFNKYTIKVNHRQILEKAFRNIIQDKFVEVLRIIDKMDKIGKDGVRKELEKIIEKEKVDKIMQFAEIKLYPEALDKLKEILPEAEEEVEHLKNVFSLAKEDHLLFDMSLVRGLDYYNGIIFEVIVEEPRIGSLGGGGRYDTLFKLFGRDLGAVGGSIGIERLIDAGLEIGLFNLSKKTVSDLYIVNINASKNYVNLIAEFFRNVGIKTRTDLMNRNWKKQVQEAEKLDIPFIAFVGKKEEENEIITLLDRLNEKKMELSLEEAVVHINSTLQAYESHIK